jgi:hypothetical protein
MSGRPRAGKKPPAGLRKKVPGTLLCCSWRDGVEIRGSENPPRCGWTPVTAGGGRLGLYASARQLASASASLQDLSWLTETTPCCR